VGLAVGGIERVVDQLERVFQRLERRGTRRDQAGVRARLRDVGEITPFEGLDLDVVAEVDRRERHRRQLRLARPWVPEKIALRRTRWASWTCRAKRLFGNSRAAVSASQRGAACESIQRRPATVVTGTIRVLSRLLTSSPTQTCMPSPTAVSTPRWFRAAAAMAVCRAPKKKPAMGETWRASRQLDGPPLRAVPSLV
jgi:hypothetical protein